MRFVKIGRRYFFGWQGEKRRYSWGYIEAFQRSQAEKEPVRIHKSCVVRLFGQVALDFGLSSVERYLPSSRLVYRQNKLPKTIIY